MNVQRSVYAVLLILAAPLMLPNAVRADDTDRLELLANPALQGMWLNYSLGTIQSEAHHGVIAINSMYSAYFVTTGHTYYSSIIHVYRDTGSRYTLEASLFPAVDFDTNAYLSMALSEDVLAVSVTGSNPVKTHLQFYAYDSGEWTLADTVPLDDNDGLGLEFAGDSLLVSDANEHSVLVYEQGQDGWEQVDALRPDDLFPSDFVRGEFAGDGDHLALSRSGFIEPPAVYVYVHIDGVWTQHQKITPPVADAAFGKYVGMQGDLLIVSGGTGIEPHPEEAAYHVYRHDSSSGLWHLEATIFDGLPYTTVYNPLAVGQDMFFTGNQQSINLAQYWFDGTDWHHGFRFVCDGCDQSQHELGTVPAIDGSTLVLAVDLYNSDSRYFASVGSVGSGLVNDCNGNRISDSLESIIDSSLDCNANSVLDECESGVQTDCNNNGVCDAVEFATMTSVEDCNDNGVPDECEPNTDADNDGVADICDNCPEHDNPQQLDCDDDGVGDVCAIASGASEDCNDDGIPDECTPTYPRVPIDSDGSYWLLYQADGVLMSLQPFTVQHGAEVVTGIGIRWATLIDREARLMVLRDPMQSGNVSDLEVVEEAFVRTAFERFGYATGLYQQWITYPIDPVTVGKAGETFYLGAMTIGTNWPAVQATEIGAGEQPAPGRFLYSYPPFGSLQSIDPASDLSLAVTQEDVIWGLRAVTTPIECLCTADIAGPDGPGGDDMVDEDDLMALLNAWGECGDPCPPSCDADLTGNCRVDVRDLLVLLAQWGSCNP